jgi:hypothetical protein
MIAAAMERKVWTRSNGKELYPNLYLLLVGEPGLGKSEVLAPVEEFLRALPDFHVSPSSVTTASLADAVAGSKRHVVQPQLSPPLHMEFNALTAVASEFGVFLPIYEPSFMNMLTKMFDGEYYSEARRGIKEKLVVEKPILSILGGTTPSYLNTTLPPIAWDQGFTSRTILVFSGDKVVVNPFAANRTSTDLAKDVAHDLKLVHGLFGEFSWKQDAMDAVWNWHSAGNPPRPMHIRLQKYNSRRLIHVLKLAMVSSVDRSNDMTVTLADYQRGLDWLLEAENVMTQIFRSGGVSGDAMAIQEARYYLVEKYKKTGRPVSVQILAAFLSEKIPAAYVMRTIEMMEFAGHFKSSYDRGVKMLVPDTDSGPDNLTRV